VSGDSPKSNRGPTNKMYINSVAETYRIVKVVRLCIMNYEDRGPSNVDSQFGTPMGCHCSFSC
jgi:hypothetical protein